jgi:hypothetical protein
MTLHYTEHGENRVAERKIPDRVVSRTLSKGLWNNDTVGEAYIVKYRDIKVVVGYDGRIVTAWRHQPIYR